MMRKFRPIILSALSASVLALSACDDAESRADKHLQNAVELVKEGDVERAALEFRNALRLNPTNPEARIEFGKMLRDRGNLQGALREYIAAAELRTEDGELQREAAELAMRAAVWDNAERLTRRAAEIMPDDRQTLLLASILEYRRAAEDEDEEARRDARQQVAQLSEDAASADLGWQVLLDDAIREGDYTRALSLTDRLIEAQPGDSRWYEIRAQLLNELGDDDGLRAALEDMVAAFPQREEFVRTLIQYYVSEGDLESAEELIRSRIASAEDPDAQRMILIAYLREVEGAERALEETEAMIEEAENPLAFRALRAGLIFDRGDREAAIAEMESLISDLAAQEGAEGETQSNDYKVALARMFAAVGNEVAARQQVEEVLASDGSHVGATKMQAAWLIQEDKPEEAILALRAALDQAPGDPEIMTLMADAHIRNGARGLAGEMLALAVEASGNRPKEATDYARFLISNENYATAETILIDSLRTFPNNEAVLALLGDVYANMQDWPRVEQVEGTLRRLESPTGTAQADRLRITRLQSTRRSEEALAYLEALAENADSALAAKVAIVRTHILGGDLEAAENFLDQELEKTPDEPILRMLAATIYVNTDRADRAEEVLRGLLSEDASQEGVWRALYTVKMSQGDVEGASAVLDEALEALPDAPNLLWARAGDLERAGDYEAAIGIYEDLYADLPDSPIIANNLASLITTYRDNDADLDRAYAVARRLRGSDVPAFQDTYGWIAYRRGQLDEALEHLEPAAEGLPEDPIVQFHLAQVYDALERPEDALAQYRKAVEIAGPADTRPQIELSRQEIERLEERLASDAAAEN